MHHETEFDNIGSLKKKGKIKNFLKELTDIQCVVCQQCLGAALTHRSHCRPKGSKVGKSTQSVGDNGFGVDL